MEPHIGHVEWLSYSAWKAGETCHWRFAYARDSRFDSLRRPNQYSLLGTVRHKLEEEAQSGKTLKAGESGEQWFSRRWEEMISNAEAKLADAWSPARTPRAVHWPNYWEVRIHLEDRLPHLINEPKPADSEDGKHKWVVALELPGSPLPVVEHEIRDSDHGLHGIVDRLEEREGLLVLVDFKSMGSSGPEDLLARHRDQMLFYAGLVHHEYGEWPVVRISIPDGTEIALDYEASEAASIVSRATQFRDDWNTGKVSPPSPSADSCQWCPFQVVCPEYQSEFTQTLDIEQQLGRGFAVVDGVVDRIVDQGDFLTAVLHQPRNLTCPEGTVELAQLPKGLDVKVGQAISANRVYARSPQAVAAGWDTIVVLG